MPGGLRGLWHGGDVPPQPASAEHPNLRRARFEALVRDDLAEPLWRFLRRRTGTETAEAALAASLRDCWRRLDQAPEPALPWAYGVARRALRDVRGDSREAGPADGLPVTDEPVREALAALGEDDAEVVRLWAWEGLAADEVTVVLGPGAPGPERSRPTLERALAAAHPEGPRPEPEGDQVRARVRDADPARSLPGPDPDRLTVLLEAAVVEEGTTESRAAGTRGRSALTWTVAAAALALIGVAVALLLLREPATQGLAGDPAPDTAPDVGPVLELTMPVEGVGRCMRPTPEVLGRADVAFDGEVAGIAGGRVVLRPTRFYAGGPADSVEVGQASPSREALVAGVRFREGRRYLVAANGGAVMVCGFSGAHSEELAELYAEAFVEPPE